MKRKPDESGLNMTPMIDVVFQLIIFFVVTIAMQEQQIEMHLRLAMSPHGRPVEKKDPRTIYIDVEQNGVLRVGGGKVSVLELQSVMNKVVREQGQSLPVVIRADANVRHDEVRKAIDICSRAGLWKIKFAAVHQAAKKAQ